MHEPYGGTSSHTQSSVWLVSNFMPESLAELSQLAVIKFYVSRHAASAQMHLLRDSLCVRHECRLAMCAGSARRHAEC